MNSLLPFMEKIKESFKNAKPSKGLRLYFDIEHLKIYAKLNSKQQKLLLDMITSLKITDNPRSHVGFSSYKEFGYSSRQNYHRDKKALENAGFIQTEDQRYIVNLYAVRYISTSQMSKLKNSLETMFSTKE